MAHESTVNRARPLEPHFSFLATRAALQLDNLLTGQGKSIDVVNELGRSLADASTEATDFRSRSALLDPFTVSVLYGAVHSTGQTANTLRDVLEVARRAAGHLESVTEETERELLIKLRAFCLALSQLARVHYQDRAHRSRPERPYRR